MQESGSSMAETPGWRMRPMASSSMADSHKADQMSNDSEPVRLATGRFHTNAHRTKGQATIYRLDDGRRVLRLTEFSTSNGPDVRVYLVARGRCPEGGRGEAGRIVIWEL